MTENLIGKKVIVRCDRSGVFYGTLAARDGREVKMEDVRCIWYWQGAATLLQLAAEGVKDKTGSRFTMSAKSLVLLDAIEILPCSDEAIKNIDSVPVWKML